MASGICIVYFTSSKSDVTSFSKRVLQLICFSAGALQASSQSGAAHGAFWSCELPHLMTISRSTLFHRSCAGCVSSWPNVEAISTSLCCITGLCMPSSRRCPQSLPLKLVGISPLVRKHATLNKYLEESKIQTFEDQTFIHLHVAKHWVSCF